MYEAMASRFQLGGKTWRSCGGDPGTFPIGLFSAWWVYGWLILVIVALWIILQDRDLPDLLFWTAFGILFATQFIDVRRKVKRKVKR